MDGKKTCFLLALVAALVAVSGSLPATASALAPETSLTYHVHIYPGRPSQVEAVLTGVSAPAVSFQMVELDWIDLTAHVSDVSAVARDGATLPVSQEGKGWHVFTLGHEGITFRYSLTGSLREARGWGSYYYIVTEEAALFFNGAVFASPNLPLHKVTVAFHVPDDWYVGTSFIPLGGNVYRVEGISDLQTDLQRNVTRLGVAETTVTTTCGDMELTFVAFRSSQYGFSEFWRPDYGNTPEDQMREYLDLVSDSVRWFESLFGFWPGGSRFWVSNRPLEGDSLHSHVGFTRWMQPWHRERLTQVPHHVLHAWIWFTQDAPIRLEAAESEWIQEGVPTFYESELTARLTGNDIWLGSTYAHYLVVQRAARFALLQKLTVSTYALGHMRALAMDKAISQATNGHKSLDDLLKLLGGRFGTTRQHFSRSQLVEAISEVAGMDMAAFYDRYYAGVVSTELPPVDDVITGYREPFLRWVDQFVSVPGNGARGSRALFFVALEIGLQSETTPYSPDSEHFVATGSGIYNLEPFRARLLSLRRTITEQDVVEALSAITGVDQSDFFEFYTVGDYRPSVKEIQEWLRPVGGASGPAVSPPATSPQPGPDAPRPEDPVTAYLSPSSIQIGVPIEVEILVRDERLVSSEGTTRLAVVAWTDKLLGRMMRGARGHYSVCNFEYQGVVTSFEVGYVSLQRTGEGWTGKVTLTLPEDLAQIQLRATEESTYIRELAVRLVAPTGSGPAQGSGSPVAETADTEQPAGSETAARPPAESRTSAGTSAAAVIGLLAIAGLWLWLRSTKPQRRVMKG